MASDSSTRSFRDFRAASRAEHRERKHAHRYNHFRGISRADLPSHPAQQSHYVPTYDRSQPFLCPFPPDLSTAPVGKFTKREAYIEARWSRPIIKHHSRVKYDLPKGENWRQAKKDAARESRSGAWDEWDEEAWWDEHYWYWYNYDTCFTDEREWSEGDLPCEEMASWDEWTEAGESFTQWCQRRINEMRAVKEARLRAKLAAQSTSSALSPGSHDDEGYHSSESASTSSSSTSPPTTTIPTNPYDIEGHDLIRSVLTPRSKDVKFPIIGCFSWFGEFEWYWHRNVTGCWYVSCDPCDQQWGEPCACKEFEGCGRWNPEGPQAYLLGNWMQGHEFEELEERKPEEQRALGFDSEIIEMCLQKKADPEEWEGVDWDVISSGTASDAWTKVDDDWDSDVDTT